MTILPFIISVPYFLTIAASAIGWIKHEHTPAKGNITATATLIVCCKNEEKQLPQLFKSIEQQTLKPQKIILVNDHSTDSTMQLLQQFCDKQPHASCINATHQGKKEALKQAASMAQTDYLIFTDADCTFSTQWVETLLRYCSNHQPDVLMASVITKPIHTTFQKCQALDFASLVAANAGLTRLHQPIYANGANLTVRQELWNQCKDNLKTNVASGDDVFMIHAIKQKKGRICFTKQTKAIVTTQAPINLKQALKQRQRWGGKSIHYTDAFAIFTAIIVFLTSLSITLTAITTLFMPSFINWVVVLYIIKIIADSLLMIPYLIQTKQKALLPLWAPLCIVYPFYTTYIALKAIIGQSTWK